MTSYVIFSSQAAFDAAHATAKTTLGLPRIGQVNGVDAPLNQQTTEVTECYPHPSDGTVAAEINGNWPENLKAGFDYKTKEEVSVYLPNEEEV